MFILPFWDLSPEFGGYKTSLSQLYPQVGDHNTSRWIFIQFYNHSTTENLKPRLERLKCKITSFWTFYPKVLTYLVTIVWLRLEPYCWFASYVYLRQEKISSLNLTRRRSTLDELSILIFKLNCETHTRGKYKRNFIWGFFIKDPLSSKNIWQCQIDTTLWEWNR